MTDKDIKKLSKNDLLEMLIEQGKEIERLRGIIKKNEAQLKNKQLMIADVGSIAEASLKMNNVFEDAQNAAQQYLENVRRLSERSMKRCAQMEKVTQEKCTRMERVTEEKCNKMVVKAEKESKAYWLEVSANLEQFMKQHAEYMNYFQFQFQALDRHTHGENKRLSNT